MKKLRQVLAIAGIVILIAMYLVLFISAILGGEHTQTLFRAALGCTIAVPVMLYAFLLTLRWTDRDKDRQIHEGLPDENKPKRR